MVGGWGDLPDLPGKIDILHHEEFGHVFGYEQWQSKNIKEANIGKKKIPRDKSWIVLNISI